MLLVELMVLIVAITVIHRHVVRPRVAAALPHPDRLAELAARLRLEHYDHGSAGGELEGFEVRIDEEQEDRHRFAIDTQGQIPDWLELHENGGERAMRAKQTHDRFFDERFDVIGPTVGGCALFDSDVRRTLLELGCVEIWRGVVHATVTASRLAALERAFRQLLEVARLLAASSSFEERLRKIATLDQNPFVRMHALGLLTAQRPHSPETESALWFAVDDPHVPAALFAAITLGARVAGKHLKRLARLAASADEERISAFNELLLHEPIEEMLPLLLEASRSFYGRFSARALRWTVQHGGRDAMLALLSARGVTHAENLVAFLDETSGMLWREAGAEARLDPEMEQAVLRIMLDARVRLAKARGMAAKVLGGFGSPAALPALKEISKGELGATADVARLARDAITRIQARKNVQAGNLSLVAGGTGGGDLSFSEKAAGGALSPLPSSPDAESSP